MYFWIIKAQTEENQPIKGHIETLDDNPDEAIDICRTAVLVEYSLHVIPESAWVQQVPWRGPGVPFQAQRVYKVEARG